MNITRLVGLSLFHAVQDALTVKKTGEKAKSADFLTYTLKYKSVQPQYPVVVSVNGTPATDYTMDYFNGIVKFNAALTSTDEVKVDYYYCPVKTYDESQSPLGSNFEYPAVAIYEDDSRRESIELGSSRKNIRANWIVEVWSLYGGERDDISDTLMEMFESPVEIIDYNIAFPLLEDGSTDSTFDKANQLFAYADVDSINCNKAGSLDVGDKPAYLAQIFVELLVNR